MVVIQLRVRVRVQRSRFSSASPSRTSDSDDASPTFSKLFNPTEDHVALREMVRNFAAREVEPQALERNRAESFNAPLFRRLGSADGGMGVLGLTVPEEFGGTDLDATAVCIVHEELSYSDPAM